LHIRNKGRFFYISIIACLSILFITDIGKARVQNHLLVTTSISIDRLSSTNAQEEVDPVVNMMEREGYPVERVVATGYTAGVESTGKGPEHVAYGITYAGVPVQRDVYSTIAADLSVFPLGTILYIPDYGYGVVTDIGSAIQGNKIDLYYETVEDVYDEWGKRQVDVFIVRMGEGSITELEMNQLNENEYMEVFKKQ